MDLSKIKTKRCVIAIFLAVFTTLLFFSSSLASSWQKSSINPVINIGQQNWKSSHVWSPYVIKIGENYKMWYTGYDGQYWRIGNASSNDGINWVDNINNPIIDNSSINENITEPTVKFDNGTYKIWFVSVNRQNNQSTIKYATSNDENHWSTPIAVLNRSQGWEINYLAHPEIIIVNNEYKIFYTGDSGNAWRIGYATSFDGINWNKFQNNPILSPSSNENPTVGGSSILYEAGKYTMYYHSNHPPTKFNYATSTDGINWTRSSDNPIMTTSTTGFDRSMIAGPAVIRDGNMYKMWYAGSDGSRWRIGYATKSAGLNVPLIKQTDSSWNSFEYDSSSSWSSDKTIGAWGCALTSAAMVLKYYGVNKLIDGATDLDPGSLNNWLKAQTDGYIGEGLINWLAVSRLSKELKTINNITAFDALEYNRIDSEDKSQLTTDLNNSQPGILEEPGHFIIAKGANGDTFDINDPYYDRLTLNDGYSNTFLSLGRYTPSFTNLSYLMAVIDPSFDILVSSSSGQQFSSYLQNGIKNPSTGISSPSLKVLMIKNPIDGNYTLSIATTSAISPQFKLKLYRYASDGNSTINEFTGYSRSDQSATFLLPYQQSGSQSVISDTTPPQIKSAKTLDKDKDGKFDAIEVRFARDINGSTVNPTGTDFTVDGYAVLKADETSAGVVEITIQEKGTNDTGQAPMINLVGNGVNTGIKDTTSNKYNNQQTIIPSDGASPTKPVVNIPGGDYYSLQTITLTSNDFPNAPSIFYTLDTTDPATSSSKLIYSSPIAIDNDLTLKAIAKDSSNNLSETLSETYVITSPTPTPTPTNSSSSSSSSSPSSSSSNSSSSNSSAPAPVCNDSKPGSAPSNISAFPGINTVTLSWKEASDPISYYLVAYGTEKGKPLYGNPNVGGKGTAGYVVENLSGGITYYFKVRAGNGCMPGDSSEEISATPIGFAEEGLATGFKEGVLGTSAEKTASKTTPSVKGVSELKVNNVKTAKETLVLSAVQKQIIAVLILIFASGLALGAYIKKQTN